MPESWFRKAEAAIEKAKSLQAELEAIRARNSPPDGEHEWLSPRDAGELLGMREAQVRRLASQARLPSARVGQRLWFRRDLLELIAAAYAFTAQVEDLQNDDKRPTRQ